MTTFTQVILFTDTDGRARFREQAIPLPEGTPSSMLSALMPSGGFQLRHHAGYAVSQFLIAELLAEHLHHQRKGQR